MSTEHNPIAQLVTKIQQKWNEDVVPNDAIKLARWLIKPEQARLYEGFLRLESTANGSIPDMTIVLLTSFTDKNTHSKNLCKDWIANFKKEKDAIAQESNFTWEVEEFEEKLETENSDLVLLEMIKSFQKALPEKDRIVTLCLFPYEIEDVKEYAKWLHNMLKLELPEYGRFMIFDFAKERHFDRLYKVHEDIAKTLAVSLDLQGAMAKLASMGDPNDPEIQFRTCLMNMSKQVEKKNLTGVQQWGNKGLEVTQRSGQKSTYATAHTIYAGMLFGFKEYEQIDNLLIKGLAIAKQGLQMGEDTCKPIIIQSYGFMASSKQMQKKKEKAAKLFCKQADTAKEYGFSEMALNAWWLAASVIKKKDKTHYNAIIEEAYKHGATLDKEKLKATAMPFLASDYYSLLEKRSKYKACKEVDTLMKEIEGEKWREGIIAKQKEMSKNNIPILNWF